MRSINARRMVAAFPYKFTAYRKGGFWYRYLTLSAIRQARMLKFYWNSVRSCGVRKAAFTHADASHKDLANFRLQERMIASEMLVNITTWINRGLGDDDDNDTNDADDNRDASGGDDGGRAVNVLEFDPGGGTNRGVRANGRGRKGGVCWASSVVLEK
ncbi:unnamed protein product [Gongylonema pulchrum]|uniref:Dimer_Tnp_hAT domain-containing protein n=1 Tax=Gongylonema pulchrum TaxID=637853 RepID=A0A183DN02_9BILA|nr:unnamed protein product [Gongylonema pulchrum]